MIALTALVSSPVAGKAGKRWILVMLGLFAASLLYGDGMITPAISVLSAVEGLRIITPVLGPYLIPITVMILMALFALQRRGTGGIGVLFGPVTLVWFLTIGSLGLRSLILHPRVLLALNPLYGARFLWENQTRGFLVLGAVFLVVTGAEALYADLGHFGRRPIRIAWFSVALPALLCSYFGQGALLLAHPEEAHHPFYALAPGWLLIPLVALATAATVIASQAVISGAFSLTRQAMQLGYMPRLQVIHTSEDEKGQVYIPAINWLLMICTIALVLGFRSSSKLAAAYGVAVTTTMLIATILFYAVARLRWGWGRWKAGIPTGLFLVVDLAFFGANISKIAHGAWFPLVIGAIVYLLLTTWKKGREILARKFYDPNPTLAEFVAGIAAKPPGRVPGRAVFMAGLSDMAPTALLQNLRHNRVLHEQVAVLTIVTEDRPKVPRKERVDVQDLGSGFSRVIARYGFMQEAQIPRVLALAREKGLDFPLKETSFFIGRVRLLPGRKSRMSGWRGRLFALMNRNAMEATSFYRIPPDQVIELGTQVGI